MVLASSGARTPGIDGMDKQRLQGKLDQHLDDLRTSLLEESYRPQPVKRIYIPKSNGKLRPLGIPTLTDRIVQRAMLMAMEPIWESDFHRLSYGFRPERSVHHAVRTVRIQLQDGGGTKGAGSSKVIWPATSIRSIIAASEMRAATCAGRTVRRSSLPVLESRPHRPWPVYGLKRGCSARWRSVTAPVQHHAPRV